MATLAKTDIAAHIPILYGREILHEAQASAFWTRFEGKEGSGQPIIVKEELTKEPGDTIRISTVKALTGAGKVGDATLEGYEEKLTTAYQDVTIEQYRHATRVNKTAGEQGIFNLKEESKTALSNWLALNLLDAQCFTAFVTSPSNVLYGGDATGIDDLDGTDVLDTTTISLARVMAEDLLVPPAFIVNGVPMYGMVVHTYQAYDLKQDDVWQQANREAMPPGLDNNLFTGMLGHWDGVVLFSHPRVPRVENGASPAVNVGKAVLFGAGAMAHAYGRYPEFIVDSFDYGNQIGTAVAVVHGYAKSELDSVDTGTVIAMTSAENPNAQAKA